MCLSWPFGPLFNLWIFPILIIPKQWLHIQFPFVNLKTCVDGHKIPCGNVAMSIEDQIKRNGSIDYTNPNVLPQAYLKSRARPQTFTILMSCQHLSQTLLEHLKLKWRTLKFGNKLINIVAPMAPIARKVAWCKSKLWLGSIFVSLLFSQFGLPKLKMTILRAWHHQHGHRVDVM